MTTAFVMLGMIALLMGVVTLLDSRARRKDRVSGATQRPRATRNQTG
jgi:hypothetical protein